MAFSFQDHTHFLFPPPLSKACLKEEHGSLFLTLLTHCAALQDYSQELPSRSVFSRTFRTPLITMTFMPRALCILGAMLVICLQLSNGKFLLFIGDRLETAYNGQTRDCHSCMEENAATECELVTVWNF